MRLAIVSPCYNEELVLRDSAAQLLALLDRMTAAGKISPDSYVMYVNDGSRDKTWDIIRDLHSQDSRICGLNLAHNVGHQCAIHAGMMDVHHHCDACVTIDADIQDDLNALEQMVDKHAAGAQIVYGVKVSREADSWAKKTSAQIFYKLLESMDVKTVYNHADFRLMSKRALDALSEYPERNLYLRGMIPMLGFKTDTVDDVLSPRMAGESKYTLSKMLRLATDGITSFSTRPIQLIITVGILMGIVSVGMLIYVIASLVMGHYVDGWASLMISLWFIGSVLTIAVGIVGTYIGKIYIEVKHRPLYHVEERLV